MAPERPAVYHPLPGGSASRPAPTRPRAPMTHDPRAEGISLLTGFGFTELEAAVYLYLVEHSPATAYRVAQGVGRAVANTYKAVESLHAKGAILIDDMGTRMCRAVPPDELLRRLEGSFAARRRRAEDVFARLGGSAPDDGLYTLASWEQVLERCATMLEGASTVVLADAFPGVMETLAPLLARCAARGVTVAARAYAPVELPGVRVMPAARSGQTLERWTGQWLCVVVDGAEYLCAYVAGERPEVRQAFWSASPLLAWVQYSLMSEWLLSGEVERLVHAGAPPEEIRRVMEGFRDEVRRAPGAPALHAQLEAPPRGGA